MHTHKHTNDDDDLRSAPFFSFFFLHYAVRLKGPRTHDVTLLAALTGVILSERLEARRVFLTPGRKRFGCTRALRIAGSECRNGGVGFACRTAGHVAVMCAKLVLSQASIARGDQSVGTATPRSWSRRTSSCLASVLRARVTIR